MPIRIQRKRTKGWRMPENTVYVGRPSLWGNPYNGNGAVREYWRYIKACIKASPRKYNINKLRGKNLCCWCPLDKPCHADVLLEIANERITERRLKNNEDRILHS